MEKAGPTVPPSTKHPEVPVGISELHSAGWQHEDTVETSVKDYQIFVTIVLTISIFGASTFAVIAGQMEDPVELWKPDPPPFSLKTVRRLLAAAWVCFILTMAVAGYSSSLLTILRQQAKVRNDASWHKSWDKIGIAASVLLHSLLVLAFLFLSLALVAYVGAIGWVGVGFSCLAGAFVCWLSIVQCLSVRIPYSRCFDGLC